MGLSRWTEILFPGTPATKTTSWWTRRCRPSRAASTKSLKRCCRGDHQHSHHLHRNQSQSKHLWRVWKDVTEESAATHFHFLKHQSCQRPFMLLFTATIHPLDWCQFSNTISMIITWPGTTKMLWRTWCRWSSTSSSRSTSPTLNPPSLRWANCSQWFSSSPLTILWVRGNINALWVLLWTFLLKAIHLIPI